MFVSFYLSSSCSVFFRKTCIDFVLLYHTKLAMNYLKEEIEKNRELTLKCKVKCYLKPTKDPLGVRPSKGNQRTTRGKEKTLLPSVGIEPTTSGLDLPLLCPLLGLTVVWEGPRFPDFCPGISLICAGIN